MTLYSLYAPKNQAPLAVADRFSWSAALVPPLHALAHGLWLMLALWVTKVVALGVASLWIGGEAAFWCYVLLAIWLGFAASEFHRRKAEQAGAFAGDWIADDADAATVAYLKQRAG